MTSKPVSGALLPVLYSLDQDHWWSAGMRSVVLALLDAFPVPAGAILEIGCGAGHMARELKLRYRERPVIGFDLHPLALPPGQHDRPPPDAPWFVQANLHRLPVPKATCGLMVALDVLDQSGVTPTAALAEAGRVLRQQGLLLARVSAHRWLQGPHDQAFGTAHRYVADEMRQLLAAAGFTLLRLTYANTLLFPLAVTVRLAERWGWLRVSNELSTPLFSNDLMRALLGVEARWLRRHDLPLGLSLYAVARKQ